MAEKQKILITDDSPLNRALLMDILGEEYDYLEAENGLIALDYLRRRGDLDLMLLDINMPELDGFGVLEQMKRFQWSDALPVIIISAEQTSSFMDRAYDLGVSDYIARPFDASVVRHRVQNTLMLHARQRQLVHILEQQVYYRERTNGTMINILSHAIESRNNESGLHTLRVRIITNLLLHHLVKTTDRYPLSEADISAIATASALHDLGKMSVPRSILNKPGKLTPEEFEIMKHHTIAGDELIATAPGPDSDPLLAVTRAICRWHHERWDGRGYPDGLVGDETPIAAQVVAVADVYDALTSERCYKKAFDHETAVHMILNGECGAFNPILMECFTALSDQLKKTLSQPADQFDVEAEAQRLSDELLRQNALPVDDHARRAHELEQTKQDFFAREQGVIRFTYDSWTDLVEYTDLREDASAASRTLRLSQGENVLQMAQSDRGRLQAALHRTTPAQPEVTMTVTLPAPGGPRQYRLTARSLWSRTRPPYLLETIGQFVELPDGENAPSPAGAAQ